MGAAGMKIYKERKKSYISSSSKYLDNNSEFYSGLTNSLLRKGITGYGINKNWFRHERSRNTTELSKYVWELYH